MAGTFFIAHVDAERGFSGGEVQVFLLIDGLARRGHRNLLVCPPDSAAARAAAARGIAVAPVPMRGDLDGAAVWRLRRLWDGAAPDLVHLHTGRAAWLGGLAAGWARRPALVSRRMDRPVARGWRTRLLYERCTRAVVAIAPGIAAQLAAGGVPADRIHVIPSAVDPARVQPSDSRDDIRAALGAAPGELILLSAAALVRRKGLDVLLDAVAALGSHGLRPRLWIAGDGPEAPALRAQADRLALGEQVRWLGTRDDIGDLLAACDAFVLPSRAEGLGVAALEAMAAGRPVAASAVGGLATTVLDERTGLLVPPGDAIALAAALERLLREPNLRARLGAAGPAHIAAHYSAAAMVAAYEQLYARILDATR